MLLSLEFYLIICIVYRSWPPNYVWQIPALGFETRTPVLMEIYFDDVLMASSEENPRRGAAMHDAYHKLAETISSEPVELLATGSR